MREGIAKIEINERIAPGRKSSLSHHHHDSSALMTEP